MTEARRPGRVPVADRTAIEAGELLARWLDGVRGDKIVLNTGRYRIGGVSMTTHEGLVRVTWTRPDGDADGLAAAPATFLTVELASVPRITRVSPADDTNQVVRVEGGGWSFQPVPCAQCPWRRDRDGSFPAEAFRISAPTAYDMAQETFGCHMTGVRAPATCAGFLLSSGAQHNLTLRLKLLRQQFTWEQVSDAGHLLHPDYRSMAEANGVDPDDPRLRPCR